MISKLALAALVATCSTSCSVLFQDSVRSSSVYCSTSRFWYVSDVLLAAADVAAVQRVGAISKAYIPAAVFGTSALLGIYKRHHCVDFREHAPPEVWAAAAEARRQQAERQAQADAAAAAEQAAANERAQAAWQAAVEQQRLQAQYEQEQGTAQQPQPIGQQPLGQPQGQPWQPTAPRAPATPPGTRTQTQTQVVAVPRSGRVARSRAECDQQLPLPAHADARNMGTDVKMAEMNREPCYRCADAQKTFSIYRLPPSYQYSCD